MQVTKTSDYEQNQQVLRNPLYILTMALLQQKRSYLIWTMDSLAPCSQCVYIPALKDSFSKLCLIFNETEY